MDKTQAWEKLSDPEYYNRLTVVGIQDLMLQAGYTADEIQKTINERGNSRLDDDQRM